MVTFCFCTRIVVWLPATPLAKPTLSIRFCRLVGPFEVYQPRPSKNGFTSTVAMQVLETLLDVDENGLLFGLWRHNGRGLAKTA